MHWRSTTHKTEKAKKGVEVEGVDGRSNNKSGTAKSTKTNKTRGGSKTKKTISGWCAAGPFDQHIEGHNRSGERVAVSSASALRCEKLGGERELSVVAVDGTSWTFVVQ